MIDAFVEALDFQGVRFERVAAKETGRPAAVLTSCSPSDLHLRYLTSGANSAGVLNVKAGRNVEVIWLIGLLAPDHNMFPNFRKDNGAAIRKVCAKFIARCRRTRAIMIKTARPSIIIRGIVAPPT